MNRREFFQNAGIIAGASMLSMDVFAAKKIKKFGCQLYSVRDVITADPKGVMTKLAGMGYKKFESFDGKLGFLWGMKPLEAKAFFNDIGVKMVSSHIDMNTNFEKKVEDAAQAGLTYLLCPYIGMQATTDAWLQKAELFNQKGEIAKKSGIQFGYHNHDYSFKFANGEKGQRILLKHTDPELVKFELDMCWSEAAGEDSIAHLMENKGRYELCHVKQLETKSPAKQTDLDKGIIDYPKLLTAASAAGIKHFLVEQEQYPSTSMESMASNAVYMKNIRI